MKKMIISFLILVGWALPTFAKTMYTSDITSISVRQGNDTKFPIIATLKSGQEVTILESAQGWTKIQLPDGKQGWLVSSYLTDEKPAAAQAPPSKRTEDLTQQLNTSIKEVENLKKENQSLKFQLEDYAKKLRDADASKAAYPAKSEEFAALKTNFEKMSAEAAKKDQKIKELEQRTTAAGPSPDIKSDYKCYVYMFLAGAGVLLLGMMIGASNKRRRSSLL
jgi:SH3 domain protein